MSNKEGDSSDVAEFISYNHETFEWIFKVPHYTNWGDESDEEDEVVEE